MTEQPGASSPKIDTSGPSDPFGERQPPAFSRVLTLLGCVVEFHSSSAALIALVDQAYAGLPAQQLASAAPRLQIQLQLSSGNSFEGLSEPPPARMQGGAGLLGALMDAANFAMVSPAARSGLVCISQQLLRFPYHARYELLEFAVFTLAARVQDLAPLHAACVGRAGQGVLLIGDSGAGKSTLALHCIRLGLDFLTEDASFVVPRTLQATGVANFLHLRADSLVFLDDQPLLAQVRASTVIRRRSGVEKFELDLRGRGQRLAHEPLQIGHVVFVSKAAAGTEGALRPLAPAEMLARLQATQPYAAGLACWSELSENMAHLPAFELRRCPHPRETAVALATLLPG